MSAGGGVTYPRVVELLKAEVAKKGQRATARDVNVALLSLQRYIKGIGEPSQATLEKLADYFEVSVAWLRGESALSAAKDLDLKTPEGEREYHKRMGQFSTETVLEVEAGIKKYPGLWEAFQSIPDENKEEAFNVIKKYMEVFSIAGLRLFRKRNQK